MFITEGIGRQLPGCDHGVKSEQTSMSWWILADNCQGQGVFVREGVGGQRSGPDRRVNSWKTSMLQRILEDVGGLLSGSRCVYDRGSWLATACVWRWSVYPYLV